MSGKGTVLCVTLALCFAVAPVGADTIDRPLRMALDVGKSNDGTDFLRAGWLRPFERTFYNDGAVYVSGYHEVSVNHWSGYGDSTLGVAYSPVFTARFCNRCSYMPYVEAGVGVALISSTKINGRDMSSLFQFEDRIGFGVRSSVLDVHFRYMHYSNADMVGPNDGIDIFVLGFSYAR